MAAAAAVEEVEEVGAPSKKCRCVSYSVSLRCASLRLGGQGLKSQVREKSGVG